MVRHFLKNGQEIKDIKGHIVKIQDAATFYALMDKINQKANQKGQKK